jgi:hypothetical protein
VVDACRDPAYAPPVPVTYFQQPVQMARQPTPAMASSDWCSALVFGNVMGNTGATSFKFPHDTLNVAGGQITYANDDPQQQQGTYQALVNTSGRGGIELSAACLTRTGLSLTCDMVAQALTSFAALKSGDPGVPCSDSPNEPAGCQFFFSYQDIRCVAVPGDACRCTYGVSFSGSLHGRWIRSEGFLTHSDASRMLPSRADYCVQNGGNAMTLWGHDRTAILDQAGIRTLKMMKAP